MKRTIIMLACTTLGLSGCDNPQPTVTHSEDAAASFCSTLASSSPMGDQSMQSAFVLTKSRGQYGSPELANALINGGNYKFIGGKASGGTCWAYAQARGTVWNQHFDLRWGCPVTGYRDDKSRAGSTILEFVKSDSCEFGVGPGDEIGDFKVKATKL